MKCNAPVERDFDIEAELLQEGLCWGLESEAFLWGEVVHEEDVLEVMVGEFVDVDISGQVASDAAVDVLDGALLPGTVGIAEPVGDIEGLARGEPVLGRGPLALRAMPVSVYR